jgi:hypothetical protein
MTLAKTLIERALRRRDKIHAWIRQTDSFATQQCRVLEVSKTDIRLEVANADSVPDKFILLFAKDGPRHHASVMWRRGTQVGVQCAGRPVLR